MNSWLDDERLEAITTTVEIGQLCRDAMEKDERVFIHRCGWGSLQPSVCCSASVAKVSGIDQRTTFVIFRPQHVPRGTPSVSPHPGQNYYCVYFSAWCPRPKYRAGVKTHSASTHLSRSETRLHLVLPAACRNRGRWCGGFLPVSARSRRAWL
jgi:hypothetical protein